MRLFFSMTLSSPSFVFFFFNDTATTEIYTLSLHDALPIFDFDPNQQHADPDLPTPEQLAAAFARSRQESLVLLEHLNEDRKSTRLNSSHTVISYAVFCLKKKNSPLCRICVSCRSSVRRDRS